MFERPHARRVAGLAALCALLLAWDASGLDLALARWSGTAGGFAWRNQALLVLLAHELPRRAALAVLLALAWGLWRPWGFLRGLAAPERWQLLASVLLALALVVLIKRSSSTSCPWELAEFGGAARYVSHWAWGLRDGGSGHCFPAGHATAAFAYLAAWPVLARRAPRLARYWLALALLVGLLLGLTQQLRGAHYLGHTLWSAWLCGTVGWIVDAAWSAASAMRVAHRAMRWR